MNSGQSCIAAKRFVIADSVFDQFTEAMVAEMQSLKVGDPMLATTDIGPMARADLRDELHAQVQQSLSQGAVLKTGGYIPDAAGCYYPPTVLTEVVPGMIAFEEELFGPVASLIRFNTQDQAIQLANQSRFGLGASVWTSDADRAQAIAAQIESGAVFVNEITKSDARMPFGGVKDSGYGRELGEFGIHAFTNIKSIWVR